MRTSITLLRIIFGFTAVPLFIMLSGCRNYYKAINTDKNIVAQSMNNSEYQQRYFILRDGSSAFYMSNITVSDDKTILHCTLDTLSPEHKLHLINGRGGNMRYKKSKPEIAVLNEVHLYIPSDANAKQGADYSLSLAKVQKVEVIEKNQGKTTASYILGGVGIAVGAFLVVGIIAIATKSSCPFVSAYDGSEMKLQGEIYGGAIYPQLARNDYLQLNMQPAPNGNLQLQISNELKEKQFTDIAELIAVTHDENVKVVADEWGNLHTVLQPQLPITATANNKNVMQLIQTPGDELNYNFNDTSAISNTLNLSFAKPAGAAKAKLVLRLKNSYWLDMVYGKFTQGFGSQYAAFIEKQSSTPVEKINEWRNAQQIPLAIDVQTSSGWQTQKSLTTFGPLANRETAVEMDISRCKSDTIHI
ncbi:MAG TPA: hypothetical protein PL045_12105, partial [Chitinophagaceae bacterium]|nr:hypothetical protein [Chitinophagaceae bacterium]